MKGLINDIFEIKSEDDFHDLAMDTFRYQIERCSVYRSYAQSLGRMNPKKIEELPFLPISFFKTHQVLSSVANVQTTFMSSGTGGERSSHFITDVSIYERSFNTTYDSQIGRAEDQVILALLPNYLEQGSSSLVYMVDHLIKRSNNPLSGFVLGSNEELIDRYSQAIATGKKVVIFGVSYALLDLAELNPDLSNAIVIETGGMKGRRQELTKSELHQLLKAGLNCNSISSEYGMTELLSQAYSAKDGLFTSPQWMKVMIRDVNDPFSYKEPGKTGGINVIDLANINSCSFIETQDLGRVADGQFEVMGRFDHSDIRGCNLLIQ